jgi:CO/xanthine dehydrogenase Mo-binding subunit
MLAQIVADELQVGHETIKCVFGDTGRIAFGIGTFASRNAVMAGTSVQMASIKVREKALELAAHLLEADTADLEFVDGAFAVKGSPQSRKSLTEVAAAAHRAAAARGHGPRPGVGAEPREHGRAVLVRHPHRRGRCRPGHRAGRGHPLLRGQRRRRDHQPAGGRGADRR